MNPNETKNQSSHGVHIDKIVSTNKKKQKRKNNYRIKHNDIIKQTWLITNKIFYK